MIPQERGGRIDGNLQILGRATVFMPALTDIGGTLSLADYETRPRLAAPQLRNVGGRPWPTATWQRRVHGEYPDFLFNRKFVLARTHACCPIAGVGPSPVHSLKRSGPVLPCSDRYGVPGRQRGD